MWRRWRVGNSASLQIIALTWCQTSLPGVLLFLVPDLWSETPPENDSPNSLKPWWPCVLPLHCCPGGRPSSFWCCAALQCISLFVVSSWTVGCCKKITSLCHCWFITLNCFLLLCILCSSGTSRESLDPEHDASCRIQCCITEYSTWHSDFLIYAIKQLFFCNLYLFMINFPVLGHNLTVCLTVCVLSVLIEE